MSLVEFDTTDGIAVLRLNRPEVLNSLSPALFVELRKHIDAIAGRTQEIGCVILEGAGRSFSAGNDLKAISAGEKPPSAYFQAETLEAIEHLPQPVIAAVKGHCYTGALELALACDLMICGEGAKLCDSHGKWGMSPTWGMSQRLPRRIGLLKAKEMMFSGRVVTGTEAVTIGLANRVVADEALHDEAIAMARSFLQNSWHTLRADKHLINGGQSQGLADALKWEREHSPGVAPDMTERVANFSKKG